MLIHYPMKISNQYSLMYPLSLSLSLTGDQSPGFSPSTPPGTPGHKQFIIHVPTASALSLPIRRYISETLICHVLGQPSYSLACLLISTISQYLDIPLPNKQLSMEEVCKLANDHYQTALPMAVIQHARSLFSQHDVAWRDSDKARCVLYCVI